MEIKCLLLEGVSLSEGGVELIDYWKEKPECKLWIDLEGELSDQDCHLLSGLNCHELAIADARRLRHPPKVEKFGDQLFILFRGFRSMDNSLNIEAQQIALFVSENLLISVHRFPSVSVKAQRSSPGLSALLAKPQALAIEILNYAAGRYLERLLEFEHELSDLEDQMDVTATDEQLKELIAYRSRLRQLRRIFSYHERLVSTLKQSDWWANDTELSHATRDLYDRTERLHSLSSMYYDICGDLIEGYISITSHQLNRTMQILTVITAIFIPLGLLAGVYGMNFEYMPELSWRYSYFVLLGAMFLIASSLIILFKRIKWL